MKDIDADYYGYRDEDDGLIVPLEQEVEKKGIVKHFIFTAISFSHFPIVDNFESAKFPECTTTIKSKAEVSNFYGDCFFLFFFAYYFIGMQK